MTVRVRTAEPADLPTYVAVRNAVTPDWGTSLDEIDWADRIYPGGARLVAEIDDRIVGAANGGRMYVHGPEYPDWWAEVTVLPDARRRGAGSALLQAVSDAARLAGKTHLQVPVSAARPEGAAFLEHRGFVEYERARIVRVDLDTDPPATDPPEGIALVSLAERPDTVEGIHRLALEALPDIPGGDPMEVGDLAEFRARDVDKPSIPKDGFFVALAGDEVVGYASLVIDPGRPTIAYHDMTAVARDWRGRGVAGALKRATIRWATEAGLEALETGNDVDNATMRAVNARLGYRPLPDMVFYRGPLLPPADR